MEGRACLVLSPCCHVLYDAVMHAGHHSSGGHICSLSPTVCSRLSPSARGPPDSVPDCGPSSRRAPAPGGGAYDRRDCGSGSHQGSESGTWTGTIHRHRLPPSRLHPGKVGETWACPSGDTRRTATENGSANARSCGRFAWKTATGGKTCYGSVTAIESDWENRSKT